MLEDSINTNNFNCNPVVSKYVVKPLETAVFGGANLHK